MKLRCPVCGEKVEAEYNYCMNCNSRLQKCIRCRTVNAAGFSYCHSCGQALQFRQVSAQYPRDSSYQIRGHVDQTVYSYLVSRGGSISWSQALQELNMSHNELKDSVGRLMNQGLLEPQQTVKQTPKLEAVQIPEVEELSTTLDPLTLTVTALMLAAVRDAKKHREYVKLDRLTSRISEIALGREMPHDASQLDFRDQLKLCTLVSRVFDFTQRL